MVLRSANISNIRKMLLISTELRDASENMLNCFKISISCDELQPPSFFQSLFFDEWINVANVHDIVVVVLFICICLLLIVIAWVAPTNIIIRQTFLHISVLVCSRYLDALVLHSLLYLNRFYCCVYVQREKKRVREEEKKRNKIVQDVRKWIT